MRNVVAVCFFLSFFASLTLAPAASTTNYFAEASSAYNAAAYEQSAINFREAAAMHPTAPGTLHNLGNAEWQCGHAGPAIFAWERAQWRDPFNPNTRANLRLARKAVQLDPPELAWYEICSTWLPVDVWAWLASLSFWVAVAMVMLPGILRWRKADWHQAVAAAGFAIFLLTIPALAGIHTRSRLGIILGKDTPLRLTPTQEAQVLVKMSAGETARIERERGQYVFIRTSAAAGWVERGQLGLIAGG
jgi:tetratricopeptide (TPR) repeat protein